MKIDDVRTYEDLLCSKPTSKGEVVNILQGHKQPYKGHYSWTKYSEKKRHLKTTVDIHLPDGEVKEFLVKSIKFVDKQQEIIELSCVEFAKKYAIEYDENLDRFNAFARLKSGDL